MEKFNGQDQFEPNQQCMQVGYSLSWQLHRKNSALFSGAYGQMNGSFV